MDEKIFELLQSMNDRMEAMNDRMEAMDNRMDAMNNRMEAMNDRMEEMNDCMESMNQRMDRMEQDIKDVKAEVSSLEIHVASVDKRLERVENCTAAIKTTLENDVSFKIQAVAENHGDLYEHYKQNSAAIAELEKFKFTTSLKINTLETKVRELENAVKVG